MLALRGKFRHGLSMKSFPTLGILGGMGPLGGADFFRTLVERTPAACEEDHIPVVLLSDPTIPRRPEALDSGEMKPVEDALVQRIHALARAGASAAVIPCNTAHFWLEAVRRRSPVPILSIVDAGVEAVRGQAAQTVVIFGTEPTMQRGLYDEPLRAAGLDVRSLEANVADGVLHAIALTKCNAFDEAAKALGAALASLDGNVDAVIVACTELPPLLDRLVPTNMSMINVTAALADKAIAWAYGEVGREVPSV